MGQKSGRPEINYGKRTLTESDHGTRRASPPARLHRMERGERNRVVGTERPHPLPLSIGWRGGNESDRGTRATSPCPLSIGWRGGLNRISQFNRKSLKAAAVII